MDWIIGEELFILFGSVACHALFSAFFADALVYMCIYDCYLRCRTVVHAVVFLHEVMRPPCFLLTGLYSLCIRLGARV
jgi:hypothetical protein